MSSTTTIERPSKAVETQRQRQAGAPESGERHWRSIVKAISWRAVGTVDTMIVSYLVTGKVKLAVSIGCVELFTKVVLFYVHERAWQRIPYGRVRTDRE